MKSFISRGFSLLELLVTIAIIAVLAGIAVPVYNSYVREAITTTIAVNIDSVVLLMEDYRLDNGNYGTTGTYSGQAAIASQYGWDPLADLGGYTFEVQIPATTTNYNMWGIHNGSGLWYRCDNRMSNCCSGEGGTTSACP